MTFAGPPQERIAPEKRITAHGRRMTNFNPLIIRRQPSVRTVSPHLLQG